jgi:hypothetical protein
MERPVFSPETRREVRQRAQGTCECVSTGCWHFKRCKTAGTKFVVRQGTPGADKSSDCKIICQDCLKQGLGGKSIALV